MNSSKFILHIGPGKSFSTWLQNTIFPDLHKNGIIDFLNLDIQNTEIAKLLKFIITCNLNSIEDAKFLEKDIKKFNKYLKDHINQSKIPVVLSMEQLHGWDPGTWEKKMIFNKYLFNSVMESTTIFLTFRETYSYLSSVFFQQLKCGEYGIDVSSYFLDKENYILMKNLSGDISLGKRFFSIEDLNYNELFNLYKKSFPIVYATSHNLIKNLDFLEDLSICNRNKCNLLSKRYKNNIYNKSFSNLEYHLYKLKEYIIIKLGYFKKGRFINIITNIYKSKVDYEKNKFKIDKIKIYKERKKRNILISYIISSLKKINFRFRIFLYKFVAKKMKIEIQIPEKIFKANEKFLKKMPIYYKSIG